MGRHERKFWERYDVARTRHLCRSTCVLLLHVSFISAGSRKIWLTDRLIFDNEKRLHLLLLVTAELADPVIFLCPHRSSSASSFVMVHSKARTHPSLARFFSSSLNGCWWWWDIETSSCCFSYSRILDDMMMDISRQLLRCLFDYARVISVERFFVLLAMSSRKREIFICTHHTGDRWDHAIVVEGDSRRPDPLGCLKTAI